MLFISRQIGFDKFGVYDTDDGTETVVSQKELIDAINAPGIVIEGVKSRYNEELRMVSASSVRPYQPPETVTMIQSKTNLLRHVEFTVWQSMITRICVRGSEIATPVTIRLSDFGTQCADLIFRGSMPLSHRHTMTLILDDKVQLADLSFILLPYQDNLVSVGTKGIGVVFDLREVTKQDTVDNVYKALLNGDVAEYKSSIIDHEDRRSRMMQMIRHMRKAAKK